MFFACQFSMFLVASNSQIFPNFCWYNIIGVLPGSNVVANRIDGKQSKIIRTSNMFICVYVFFFFFFYFSFCSFLFFRKIIKYYLRYLYEYFSVLFNYFHKIWAEKALRSQNTTVHTYTHASHARHWKLFTC